ncbi:putative RNA methyltransferase [Sediminibacillus halophilus]|uniref:23S rRNA (Guanine745-N1)-methyltransferase n=1 Tax=Sediminibacillus halophilus TaxID=482461 RepID=A0A1G9P2H1_9BACI|nr:methyltransferase domain-containing protein [Sediminibacillus halophilus]SDL92743.1 23S rRNA (guanine745-N1)-methyltransferase [Sediminibacillus halophilus]
MLQKNKRIKSAKYVSNFENIFACPICKSSMKVIDFKCLICSNHHTFDFAKQGYVNLTTHSPNSRYSKSLFEARRKFITEGEFFKPLNNAIAKIINEHLLKTKDIFSVLDTGCGEGSHLSNICDIVQTDFSDSVVGVGIDISKEGIMVASKNYSNKIWAVADLANTPFKNTQFDVILNILSPSNYAEFNRLLKSNGIVIKIVPQSGYLKELRENLFLETEKQNHSNARTVERFNQSFQYVERSRLSYTINLNKTSIEWLVQMTPLTWSTTSERVKSFKNKDSAHMTVDLDILVGRNTI